MTVLDLTPLIEANRLSDAWDRAWQALMERRFDDFDKIMEPFNSPGRGETGGKAQPPRPTSFGDAA